MTPCPLGGVRALDAKPSYATWLWWPVLALTLLLSASPSAAQTPQADVKSHCGISEDPAYAFTMDQPVQVGGGPMFVAARERRYLDALRGPGGEVVRYRRSGTASAKPNALPILDVYEVTYAGLEKPVRLYLDAYHFDDALLAPAGFICGAPIGLNPPGPDYFQATDDVTRLAIERGPVKDYDPIPLVPNATSTRGVAFDHFRMAARHARAAAAAGTPIVPSPTKPLSDTLRPRLIIVAYPIACEGRTIAARAIDVLSAQGGAAPRLGESVTGDALAALLPGFDAPPSSLAATFNLQAPRPNDTVKITYAEACSGADSAALPVRFTPARLLTSPPPTLPAGTKAPNRGVRLQAQIDLDGTFQRASYIGGPTELVEAAMQAIKGWTVEPATVNGAPISTPATLMVTFAPAEAGRH